jgi:hypothetical protein
MTRTPRSDIRVRSSAGLVTFFVICLGVVACGESGKYTPTSEVVERCDALGGPVTAAKLVDVFRANGVTLDVNYWGCERSDFTEVAATNAGITGLESKDEVESGEGFVLCGLTFEEHARSRVEITKFPTDTETYVSALNATCSVYPSDSTREDAQVRRVANALRAVSRAVPEVPAAEECGSKGTPLRLADVADILRDNGIALMRINQAKCENPNSGLPDATNAAPRAKEREGIVSCWVGSVPDPFDDLEVGEERDPVVTVREVRGTTTMTVLNVRCTIDPSEDQARRQVAALRAALDWL